MADEGVKCSDCGLLGPLMSYGWHSDCKPFVEVLASRALAAEALLRECVPLLKSVREFREYFGPNAVDVVDDLLARVREQLK